LFRFDHFQSVNQFFILLSDCTKLPVGYRLGPEIEGPLVALRIEMSGGAIDRIET